MLNSSQLTKRREARTVYADFISQQERVAQGCASNTAYSQGGLDSSTRLEILQGQIYTPSTTTAAILSNSACPGCNLPPVPPVPSYVGSIHFTAASNSYLSIDSPGGGPPYNSGVAVGTSSFTVEWFQYQTSAGSLYPRVFSMRPYSNVSSDSTNFAVSIEQTYTTLHFWYRVNDSIHTQQYQVLSPPTSNTWSHYAVVGSNNGVDPACNVIMIYDNGTQILSNGGIPYDIADQGNWPFTIGAQSDNGNGDHAYFDGYITNFRLVRGTALYTSNFTVPSLPLSNIAGTQLLLLAGSNAPFVDSSSNYTLSNVGGGVTWASNGPPL